MINVLLFISILLASATETTYQNVAKNAQLIESVTHEDADTFLNCNNKIKIIIFKDSVLNKPGSIGTEYNYPIYKYETEIIYYANGTLAAIESKEIQLKRYEYKGVTTGIQIITKLDTQNTYYFNQEQEPISRKQLLEIQEKICSKNKE